MIIRHSVNLAVMLWFALALLPQTQDTGDTTDAQIIEGDYRVTSVEGRRRAVENLLNSVNEHRKSGQVIEAARALNRVGRFQIRMSRAKDAVTTFQNSLAVLDQQDPKTKIDSLNGLASSYSKLSKCDLVEPAANEALDLSNQNNYVAGQAEALLILSDCQNFRDHALALKTAQESLARWTSIDRKRGMADTYVAIGEYHMTQHNLDECSRSLDAASSIYRELNDAVGQAEVLIYRGYIEYRNAAWKSSLDYYAQAELMIDKEAEPYRMGQITIGLGDSFLESGMPDVAIPKYRESLEYFRITENPRAMSILKWSIGRAHYFDGQYNSAIEDLQTARTEAQSNGDVTLTAFCDDFLGRTYEAKNDDATALSYFQSALDGYSKAKNPREAARVLAMMGRVYQQQGRFQKARDNYHAARDTFRRLSDRVNEAATLYAVGALELQENNLATAAEYLQQSIQVTEQMRRASSSSDLTVAFSARLHERYQRYIDCLMRMHSANPTQRMDVRAFEMSESARSRSLAELLRATQTNLAPGVDLQLAEREKSLRQTLRVKENFRVSLLARQYKQEELNALESELTQLESEYKQVNDAITAQHPSYGEINRPTSWDLRQIQTQVVADEQTMLLEFSLGPDRSYVWVVTHNNITSRELPPEASINEAAQDVYSLLSSKPGAETESRLSEAVRKLSSMVLAPVADHLNKRRVIVVADGALNYIPFQILRPQPDKEEQLVASCEVNNGPSASILGQLRQETSRRKAPSKVLAAFGDPIFASNYSQRRDAGANEQIAALQGTVDQSWQHALRNIEPVGDTVNPADIQPLFYSTLELANLREVAGPESFVATGFDATSQKLAEVDLTEFAILHIATHGILDPKRPENSGLFLSMVDRTGQAQNGFLGLADIYRLRAPVELVVLSACRTGLGKDVRGEGLIGLTRGFMYAGASSVVASLWKVDDEATAELMKLFYTNMLQKGMTPAEALRAAQNSIREQPQWRSPYFWAAFTLQGDHRQVVKPISRNPRLSHATLYSIGAATALFAIALWWYHHRRATRRAG